MKVTEIRNLQSKGEIPPSTPVHVKYNRDETVKWLRKRLQVFTDASPVNSMVSPRSLSPARTENSRRLSSNSNRGSIMTHDDVKQVIIDAFSLICNI